MNRSVFGGAVATAGVPRPASAVAAVPAPSSYLLIGKQVAFTVAQDFTPVHAVDSLYLRPFCGAYDGTIFSRWVLLSSVITTLYMAFSSISPHPGPSPKERR